MRWEPRRVEAQKGEGLEGWGAQQFVFVFPSSASLGVFTCFLVVF